MERYCTGCSSDHYTEKNSWDGDHPGKWNYFKQFSEGYDVPKGNYATRGNEWTHYSNVSPNAPQWVTKFQPTKHGSGVPPSHTEKFCFGNHSTYSSLNQTWMKQKPYSSN